MGPSGTPPNARRNRPPSFAPADTPARRGGLRSQHARDNLREMAQDVEDRNVEPTDLRARSFAEQRLRADRGRAIENMLPGDPGVAAPMGPDFTPAASPPPPLPTPTARPQGRRRTAPTEGTSANDLNEISLRLARGATPTTPTEQRLARAMGLNFKKGGLVDSKKAPPPAKGASPQFGKTPPKGPPNMFKKKGK